MTDERIAEPLRRAIAKSSVSRAEIARKSGVAESVLSRFLAGKQGITLETAGRLAEVLGLRLTGRGVVPIPFGGAEGGQRWLAALNEGAGDLAKGRASVRE